MQPELETYLDQLLSIRQDADGLMSRLTDEQFNWQPGPGRLVDVRMLRPFECLGGTVVHSRN